MTSADSRQPQCPEEKGARGPVDLCSARTGAERRMDCLQGNSTTAATDLELVPSPNLPKNEDSRQPQCPEDKASAIVEALKHFKMNS